MEFPVFSPCNSNMCTVMVLETHSYAISQQFLIRWLPFVGLDVTTNTERDQLQLVPVVTHFVQI